MLQQRPRAAKRENNPFLTNNSALPSPRPTTCQTQQDLYSPTCPSQVHQHSCLYLLTKTLNPVLTSSPGPSTLCMNPTMTFLLLTPGCHSAGGEKPLALPTGQVYTSWVQWAFGAVKAARSSLLTTSNSILQTAPLQTPLTHCPSISAGVLQSDFAETIGHVRK